MGKGCDGEISSSEKFQTGSPRSFQNSPTFDVKPKLSFEDELTFSPKLNSLSLKLAEVNRTTLLDRKTKNKRKQYESTDFIFKPTVSKNSNKIAAKLKNGFWERQKIHVQHQKEMLEHGPSTVHPNLRSPTKSSVLCNQTKATYCSTSSLSTTVSADTNSSFKTESQKLLRRNESDAEANRRTYSASEKQILDNQKIMNNNKAEHQHMKNKTLISSRKLRKLINKTQANEDSCRKKEEITTCTVSLLTNNNSKLNSEQSLNLKNTDSLDKVTATNDTIRLSRELTKDYSHNTQMEHSRFRSMTFPQYLTRRHDDIERQQEVLAKLKKMAACAIKSKKIFVCNGPYHSLRAALRKRGWIEKSNKTPAMHNFNLFNNGKDNTPEDENSIEQLCIDHYNIISRYVRNSIPSFIWTVKRDDIDFQLLRKDQIVNHFALAWVFTTKSGLCINLRKLHHFLDASCHDFFPRCYRLGCDVEKTEFLEDFRLTACCSVLKLAISNNKEWKAMENDQATDDLPHSAENSIDENRMTDSNKEKKCYPSTLLLSFMTGCYNFLDRKQHLDIEQTYSPLQCELNEEKWALLILYYYELAHNNAFIKQAWMHLDECKKVLQKMAYYCPQINIDGHRNIWILKPGAKSRGRGIELHDRLHDILKMTSDNVSKKENRWVIQKYIEQPYLIHRTKFDIRQWFLITDWNPMVLWFYKDSYIRFCGQEFTFNDFGAQYHLSNNSIQKHYNVGERSQELPNNNMWSSDEFKEYLNEQGYPNAWESIIYIGMKEAINAVMQACQDSLEYRKNTFELYGADFMVGEDLKPWLIEINSSPALGASTAVTERLCKNVVEDTLKVVLDRRENKMCNTGQFELAFTQEYIPIPNYMGYKAVVEGIGIKKPSFFRYSRSVRSSVDQLGPPEEPLNKSVKPSREPPNSNNNKLRAAINPVGLLESKPKIVLKFNKKSNEISRNKNQLGNSYLIDSTLLSNYGDKQTYYNGCQYANRMSSFAESNSKNFEVMLRGSSCVSKISGVPLAVKTKLLTSIVPNGNPTIGLLNSNVNESKPVANTATKEPEMVVDEGVNRIERESNISQLYQTIPVQLNDV